ncbi:TRAP transporter small permease [Treponema parvum]|uniref:TRAP transporter small permease n=1 Tax=Treponema parvum TaxID=138851 RepID=A0A975F3T4_9SPIR|nr:TRAP transporter small permease [Treponema parvum]QTQ13855.1 TRAP transporter small permease [Treponema parvum]
MERFITRLSKAYDKLCKAEMVFCCILFFTIVSLVFVSAILRKFNTPVSWTVDISQLCFAWTAFFGADIALRKGSLVGVDIVTMRMTPKIKKICKILTYIFMFFFVIILLRYGFPLAIKNWNRSFQTLSVSYSFVTLSLPCASIFMIMSIIHNLSTVISSSDEDKGEEKCGCY